MPSAQSVIETLGTPPLAALQQVLDLNGPYTAGDHSLGNFRTNGAFLLPSGTYPVAGTYGVVVEATVIPIRAGRWVGFNGIVGGIDVSRDKYMDVYAQVNIVSSFPISGAKYVTDTWEIQYGTEVLLWNSRFATFEALALHVMPGWTVDLYYMCVL